MSQNFSNYNGMPDDHADNTFGGLSNSLIFPSPSPFQQSFQQGWSTTPGWQASGQNSYNMGNIYPGQMMGPNGYFPPQQDYTSYDEGDNFYDNVEDTPMDQDNQGITVEPRGTSQSGFSNQQMAMRSVTTESGSATPASRQQEQPQARSQAAEKTPSKSTDPVVTDRLAELRAKLLSRSTGGKTPTPEAKEPKGAHRGVANGTPDQDKKHLGHLEHQKGLRSVGHAQQLPIKNNGSLANSKDDKSTANSRSTHLEHADPSTDIEALFDEARAVMAAEKSKTDSRTSVNEKRARASEHPNGTAANPVSATQMQSKDLTESRRQSLSGSNVSSETSEQGEIREDHGKPERAQPAPVQSTEFKSKLRAGKEEKIHQSETILTSAKQPLKEIDSALANGRINGNSDESAKAKSPISSTRTPSTSKPKQARDAPAFSDYRDKLGRDRISDQEQSAQGRRQSSVRERSRETYGQERQHEGRPFSRYRNPIEETERAAAEYKRKLQMAKSEPREVIGPPPAEEPKLLPDRRVVEYFEDAEEWLEMTGYNDLAYRKKALTRHRKIIELDKQRAELEREAQNEYEERSHIARAQSMMPRESIEGRPTRATISPRAVRAFPSISMPPPPIPLKENRDDVGIKIKDLANREPLQESPTSLTTSVKRQYPDDDFESGGSRPVEKQARTDSKDYSFERKILRSPTSSKPSAPSLESRISIDDGTFKREYQRRSRSAEIRRKSVSPFARRVSGGEAQLGRQNSGGSLATRNGYSPNRRPGLSRDTSPSRRGEEMPYEDLRDAGPRARYDDYRSSYDNRSNAGYEPYNSNQRPYYPQYQTTGYRGRGRGRGGYANTRGGNYSRTFKDGSSK
ncbi:hypothetical protein MMC24_001145 [Lignoscripta atroalba]|nr:hypothetical protein [Lignoscripta atroalba]